MNKRLIVCLTIMLATTSSCSLPARHLRFDFDEFFGERIIRYENVSPNLKSIDLNISLPNDYQMLFDAKPSYQIFTKDKQLIIRKRLESQHIVIPFNQTIVSDLLFIELNLYYCKIQNNGVCLTRNVLFEIPVNLSSGIDQLNIDYQARLEDGEPL